MDEAARPWSAAEDCRAGVRSRLVAGRQADRLPGPCGPDDRAGGWKRAPVEAPRGRPGVGPAIHARRQVDRVLGPRRPVRRAHRWRYHPPRTRHGSRDREQSRGLARRSLASLSVRRDGAIRGVCAAVSRHQADEAPGIRRRRKLPAMVQGWPRAVPRGREARPHRCARHSGAGVQDRQSTPAVQPGTVRRRSWRPVRHQPGCQAVHHDAPHGRRDTAPGRAARGAEFLRGAQGQGPGEEMSAIERLNEALAGRYLIERELGAGGMATVFLAEDLKHKRKVALKVLKPELAAVLGAERFVQEITTTASLQHPHILALFDSGTADDFLFYVMPWIQGETLREKLNRESQLGVDEAVRIAREVLDALEYAHQHGIVHRDIKPENILLHGGHAMVADFGIALAVSAAAGGRMTETGLSLGTPHYMSPEQATAEKEISARSDVYSLGSVLYEMLTGQPPHIGGSAQQFIMKIITESAAPVTQHRKSVPSNVAAAVAKALEKLPADRFESAKAFGDALGNPAYTSATFTGALPAPAPARRQRIRDAVLVGILVAAVAVPTGWWLSERVADAP